MRTRAVFFVLLAACASKKPQVPKTTPFATALLERPQPAVAEAPPIRKSALKIPPRRTEAEEVRGLITMTPELRRLAANEAELATRSLTRDELAALAYLRSPAVHAARPASRRHAPATTNPPTSRISSLCTARS